VGQDELEVTRTAHSTLVVMAPGMGDEVQAIKAGILECADAFAVNKADREGADSTVRDLELMIALGNETMRGLSKTRGHKSHDADEGHVASNDSASPTTTPGWTPPIVKCVATKGEGIAGVVAALDRHRAWLEGTDAGKARRRQRLAEEVRDALREALIDAATHDLGASLDEAARAVEERAIDPYTAIERLVDAFRRRQGSVAGVTSPAAPRPRS
jgi:LAO/AO transport system kinase